MAANPWQLRGSAAIPTSCLGAQGCLPNLFDLLRWCHSHGHHRVDHDHPSYRDHDHRGFETDHVDHSHGRDRADHLYEESNHVDEAKGNGRCDEGEYGHDDCHGCRDHLDRRGCRVADHDPSRSAMTRREECGPTRGVSDEALKANYFVHASIFNRSSRPIRLLCISWYASSASRRLSYSTNAKLPYYQYILHFFARKRYSQSTGGSPRSRNVATD